MDAHRLRTVIRWACVPIVSVVGVVVAMGVALVLADLFGVPGGPAVVVVVCILASVLFVVPGALMAPSYRVAVAGGAGFILSIFAVWVLGQPDPIGLLLFAGAIILVVWQDGHRAHLAEWPILRPAYGTHRRAVCVGALSVLLVSVAGFVFTPRITHCVSNRSGKARADLWAINEALNLYRHDLNALPATEAGLRALVNDADPDAGYLSRVPIDPWGNDYVYERVGNGFRVVSYGADGVLGGEGVDADIELRDGKLSE